MKVSERYYINIRPAGGTTIDIKSLMPSAKPMQYDTNRQFPNFVGSEPKEMNKIRSKKARDMRKARSRDATTTAKRSDNTKAEERSREEK